MLKCPLTLLFLLTLLSPFIQGQENKFFISFTNKNNSPFSINAPQEFLSSRAIERRIKQEITIEENDLPVSPHYLDSITQLGIHIINKTKWLNGVIATTTDQQLIDTLTQYNFIQSVKTVWKSSPIILAKQFPKVSSEIKGSPLTTNAYGKAFDQIHTVNGDYLHEQHHSGENIHIAILDAGFYKTDELPAFETSWQNNSILGSKDFVDPDGNIFNTHTHGMQVFSIMAGNITNEYLGTAPKAKYWLLRTEDADSEYPIEEYNWVVAAEFADSAGVDIINSSLGYYLFDDPTFNYTYNSMNGKTAIISQGANIAASKGILIINSAGNEGSKNWKYIIAPADAPSVLTIGAMTQDSTKTSFSSIGPSSDGRTKPDIMAMGQNTAIQLPNGSLGFGNGTSFSAPVIAGLSACLWEAVPNYTNWEIMQLIKESCHHFHLPTNENGYGIPNFKAALEIALNTSSTSPPLVQCIPNPFTEHIKIVFSKAKSSISIKLYNLNGQILFCKRIANQDNYTITGLASLSKGIYILSLTEKDNNQNFKVIKQ